MLASRFRLPGYLIPEVKAKGRFYRFPAFSLIVLEDKKQKVSKFAVILSVKFDKRAVVRNKVKRNLLDSVRLLIPEIKPGHLVIFLPRKMLIEKKFEAIHKEVEKAFGKARLI